jgi:hypothetical protein
MYLERVCGRAEKARFESDLGALNEEEAKIGEGVNNPVHFSPRGYVVKPVIYDWQSADPFEQKETVNDVERFPWVEVEELESDAAFNRAMVRMEASDLNHSQAADAFHISDVIQADIGMFAELREEGITYKDMKPDNIGYFWNNEGLLEPRPIDVFDGYAWEEQEQLSPRKLAGILDTYIQGTEDEPGVADLYPVSMVEVERQVMEHLDMDEEYLGGDPYHDIMEARRDEDYEFL